MHNFSNLALVWVHANKIVKFVSILSIFPYLGQIPKHYWTKSSFSYFGISGNFWENVKSYMSSLEVYKSRSLQSTSAPWSAIVSRQIA